MYIRASLNVLHVACHCRLLRHCRLLLQIQCTRAFPVHSFTSQWATCLQSYLLSGDIVYIRLIVHIVYSRIVWSSWSLIVFSSVRPSVHNCGYPEPDTGQQVGELLELGSEKDNCGRLCCPKCGSRGYWNKSRMIRVAGHCILFIFLASCAGFIVNSGIGQDDPTPDLAEIVESPLLKDIQLHPVPLSELRKKLQYTKNYYDFLRIFLTKKDVSNDVIDDIVNARTIQKILESRGKKARDYDDDDDDVVDDDDYDYSNEMAMDAEQARLDEELTEAWYHQVEMETSPLGECKTPQPEIVNVIDHENRNRIYLPECTVVYRCRNVSGCCGSTSSECGPKRIQVIERSFIVMNTFGDEMALPGKDMVEKRVFINHTECGCKEKLSLPDCDQYRCPYPFTKMRRGRVECTCDCQRFTNENNYLCQGIKDGVIPLTETDLACIKSGECLKPVCTNGTLHVPSGHCPLIPLEDIRYPELQLAKVKNKHNRHVQQKHQRIKERELDIEEEDIEPELGSNGVSEFGIKTGSELETDVQSKTETEVPSKVKAPVNTKVRPQVETQVDNPEKTIAEIEVENEVQPQVESRVKTTAETHVVTVKTPLEAHEEPVETPVKKHVEPVETPVKKRVESEETSVKTHVETVEPAVKTHVESHNIKQVEAPIDPKVIQIGATQEKKKGTFSNTDVNKNLNKNKNVKNKKPKSRHMRKGKKHIRDSVIQNPEMQSS